MKLDRIVKEHKLNHGTHDGLIRKIEKDNTISSNVLNMYHNAYYKIRDNSKRGGFLEGDIDLLQMFYDSSKIYADCWKEVPFNDATLLLFEMKSSDTTKNYTKALTQLKKSKNMVKKYTDYQSINTFYVFNVGKSYVWRIEEV